MTVWNYNIMYGIPLTQDELVTLFMYFANIEGSCVSDLIFNNKELQKVSIARIISDTYHGAPNPHVTSHNYQSASSQSHLQLSSTDDDDYNDYTDSFTDFTDCLEEDLKYYNCGFIVTWKKNYDTTNLQQVLNSDVYPREIPTPVIGSLSLSFKSNDYNLPELTRIESILPWTVSQFINTAFPHGTTALQMSTRCGLFLNVRHQ